MNKSHSIIARASAAQIAQQHGADESQSLVSIFSCWQEMVGRVTVANVLVLVDGWTDESRLGEAVTDPFRTSAEIWTQLWYMN